MEKIAPNSLSLCDALVLLERLEKESVDLVYLDPPWNTGKELSMQNDEYFDFIYKILQQSHRVLKADGNIFLFSNYEQEVDFHMLARKVFEAENRKIDFVIPRKRYSNSNLSSTYDTLIVYGKSNKRLNTKVKRLNTKEIGNIFPFNDSKGKYRKVPLLIPASNRPKLNFEWEGVTPASGLIWRYTSAKLDELNQQGLVEFSEGKKPLLKSYALENDEVVDVGAIWDDVNFVGKQVYAAEQSISFVERVLLVGSNTGDIVLDPFCGSGTMPVACLQLRRQFIANDSDGGGFRLSMERIEHSKPKGTSLTLLDEEQIVQLPIVWDRYRAVSPTEEDFIIELLKNGEGDKVEFKESLIWNHHTNSKNHNHQNTLKSMPAFMNSDGGIILLGVKDDSTLLGLQVDYEKANPQKKNSDGYALYLNQWIRASLGSTIAANYTVKFYEINDCHICAITISPSKTPVFLDKSFFIRNGNQTIELKPQEFYDYLNVRFHS